MTEIINGYNLHFEQVGKGRNVVFLHGWGADTSAFLFVAKAIASDYCATVIDFAGFGKSDMPPCDYTVKDYARDVILLLDSLKIDSAIFVGHSFGGRVCIELATHFPARVTSIVLIDSAGLKPRRNLKYYLKVITHKLLKCLGFKGLKGSSDYQALPSTMRQTFKNVIAYHQNDLISSISCPTAIFWGVSDKDTPLYMFNYLKSNVPNNEAFILKGGHFSYAEDYSTFLPIFKAYLKQFK